MAKDSKSSGEETQKRDHSKLIAEAHARFTLAKEANADIHKIALEDLKFRAGEHWPDHIKQAREADGRPCLVINKAPQFVQAITNDQRQNRPSIKVNPVDDTSDVDTAKIYSGLIRHIEYNSGADAAYDTAGEAAVTGGFGFWRVVTDYVSPLSFDQELLIKRIPNAFSVLLDPFCREPDGSDANFGFIFDLIPKDEFRAQFPDSKLSSDTEWELVGNQLPDWVTSEGCVVAEYFYKKFEKKTIHLLDSGEVVFSEDLEKIAEGRALRGEPPVVVVNTREAQIPSVKWCKLNGCEVLEETDWPGRYIPIIPVYGQELNVDGKRILEGVIRHAKDPSRMYDYWASAETEAIALAPRTPWLMYEGQDAGYEDEWATANQRNHAVLKVATVLIGGQPAPLPQRNSFEPAVQAITQARMLASDDMKSTTGLYDAARGAQSNETSGRAILARANQAQTGNFHFTDNLTRSIRHTGRVLVDLIPKIYDTARAARIIGEDGEQEIIRINQEFEHRGEMRNYDLGVGKYDVTVSVGPSYASKRQEAATSMLELSKAAPQLMATAGDLLVKNMDWPGAQEIAERIKKTLPPGLADDPDKKKSPVPPEVQAQMQQMGQMIESLTAKANEQADVIHQKRVELESKERIEFAKLETQLEIERAKLDARDSLALLSTQISQIEGRLAMLNMSGPIEDVTQYSGAMPPQGSLEQFAPPVDGAMSADVSGGASMPTGGLPPGSPMEGNP